MSSRASSSHAADAGAFFDGRAERYDRAYDAPGSDGYALRSRMEAVLRLVGAGPGEILDIGMGPGRLLVELERRGWDVSGVDASTAMVMRARQRLPRAAERIIEGEMESLPVSDASFDSVVATGVLEYAEIESAIREIARVLRPGGVAVVSYPNPSAYYVVWKTHVWYRSIRAARRLLGRPQPRVSQGSHLVTIPRLRALMGEAGLHVVATEYTCYLVIPSPADYLLPQTTERLGRWLERNAMRRAGRLSCQVVLRFEKATS
ncbi:MAG: class I SAM-dependent methyltransferase [Gemmatimonadota bacterium]|nr:class I SAM-dependent methyltransferase [Gemmatimonadota bacterium]